MSKTEEKEFFTDYYTASHWGGTALILCNNIPNIDDSVWDNMRFPYCSEEDDSYVDIYQWFITNMNESDVEWAEETFPDLKFTYSNMLDCYILCVDHFGTMWKGVSTRCSKSWLEVNKDLEYK